MFSLIKTPLKLQHGIALLLSCFILTLTLISQSWNDFVLVADQTIQSIPSSASWRSAQLAQVGSPSPSSGQLAQGLIGWWKFDEGNGTTARDASGNGNTGTLTNGPTWTTDSKVGSGALSFDGTNDYINTGSAPSLEGLGPLTYSAWIYPTSWGQGSQGYLFSKSTGLRFQLLSSYSQIRFYVGYSTANLAVGSAIGSISLNKWVHVVVTWDGSSSASNTHIYLNGGETTNYQIRQDGNGSKSSIVARPFIIGADDPIYGSGRSFNGVLDDVRIYSRALSPQEIIELYNYTEGLPAPTTNQSPIVSAGSNQTITLLSTANLTGTASDDGLPSSSSLTTTWSMISGPGTVIFSNVSSLNTTAAFLTSGTYVLQLSASDSALTSTSNVTIAVNSAQSSDTQAPTVPTGLTAMAVSSSQINLLWNASTDNVVITGYNIYRNGSKITTTGSTSYNDTGLNPSTSYTYMVSAYDAVPNTSTQSSSISTTTQSPSIGTENIYISQTAQGSNDGSSCFNSHPVLWFNTALNWTTLTTLDGKIGPGDTVHLCGTFTSVAGSSMLTVQGSGNAGSPITIFFEPNVQISAPYWGGNMLGPSIFYLKVI